MWVYMSVYGCIWGTAGGKTHISQLSTCWLVTRIIIIFYHASYICPSLWSVSFPFSLPPWSPYYQDHLWYLVVYASAIGTWWSWKELAMVSTADASAWGQPLTSRARAKCTTAPSGVWCTVPSSVGFSICWRHPFRVWSWHTLLYISSDYNLATAINCPLSRAAPHQLEIMPEEMENIICQLLSQLRKSLASTVTHPEIVLEVRFSSSLFFAQAAVSAHLVD